MLQIILIVVAGAMVLFGPPCEQIDPEPRGSFVKWSMAGNHNFLGKAIGLFRDMDKLLGGDIEKGLVRLKAVAEGK